MRGTSMQHLWKYDLSIHSLLSLLLNWSSGTPLLQNNKFLHCNNHMSRASLGKLPLATRFLAVSFRKKPDSYMDVVFLLSNMNKIPPLRHKVHAD